MPETSLVSLINDAAFSPEAWPQALEKLTEAASVGGAALIISNRTTRQVEQACFSGLSAGRLRRRGSLCAADRRKLDKTF